jgi:hypothetical protein
VVYCADDARAAAVHVDFLTDVHEALVIHGVPVEKLSVMRGLLALTHKASRPR